VRVTATLVLALCLMACGSDSSDETETDAAPRSDGGASLDAGIADGSVDASVAGPDASPSEFTLTLTPGAGGSIDVSVDSVAIGSCPQSQTCNFNIEADETVILSSIQGNLRHCSWTGDCAGFGLSSSCFLVMDQERAAGANYDSVDADCP
jgi:hypothetical protein